MSIHDDDFDAIPRLEVRLAELEAARSRIAAYNASCRKGQPDLSMLDSKQLADLESAMTVWPHKCEGGRVPSYISSNLSGQISRTRKRLVELEMASQHDVLVMEVWHADCLTCDWSFSIGDGSEWEAREAADEHQAAHELVLV